MRIFPAKLLKLAAALILLAPAAVWPTAGIGHADSNGPQIFLPVVISNGETADILPPGSPLPSDETCAAAVTEAPENRAVNAEFNATPGSQSLASNFFPYGSVDPRANTELATRVTGNFTGTTDEILQWAACKWGINPDIVRAQAAVESWWHQTSKGDWSSNKKNCAPGHEFGVDGRDGLCAESWGMLQNRYPNEKSSWPGIHQSTAFNLDTSYMIWRACYEGYEIWLNHVDRGSEYSAGDAWGCVGRWLAGRWHTRAAESYITHVKDYVDRRIWEMPNFQEP
jgi:hypothetical protein